MSLAPIVLFVYNRKDHLEKTIEALKQNELAKDSDLYIFSDGPKKEGDEKVQAVRDFLKQISGFRKISISIAEKNKGLANSIINGVSTVIDNYGKVIVLEDDIITSPFFLDYMNQALELYHSDEKVMHVSGYMFPVSGEVLKDTFFLKPTSCWGWGTWKRAWGHFSNDISEIEKRMDSSKRNDFNLNGAHDYYEQIRLNKEKKIKTWAIFWYASSFLNNGLSLHPKKSYCQNIGHDGSGTHCATDEAFVTTLNLDRPNLVREEQREDSRARDLLIKFYRSSRIPFHTRVINKLRKIIG